MVNREITEDVIKYGRIQAQSDPILQDAGFLTHYVKSEAEMNQARSLANQAQGIIREIINQLEINGIYPDDYQCRVLFQYVFDKVAEVTYKSLVGEVIETEPDIIEALEYFTEPDLPDYIQQKLNNITHALAGVASKTLEHIEMSGYRTNDLENWFLPFLVLAGNLALLFASDMYTNEQPE